MRKRNLVRKKSKSVLIVKRRSCCGHNTTLMRLNKEIIFSDLTELPMGDRWTKSSQAGIKVPNVALPSMHLFGSSDPKKNHIIDSM